MLGPQKQSQRHAGKVQLLQDIEVDDLANISSSDDEVADPQLQTPSPLPPLDQDHFSLNGQYHQQQQQQHPQISPEKISKKRPIIQGFGSSSLKQNGPGSYMSHDEWEENLTDSFPKMHESQIQSEMNTRSIIFPKVTQKEETSSTQVILNRSFQPSSKSELKHRPIHHKHQMSETVIQLNKNSLLGTIKKFAFNFSKKLKSQNARSNSYLFDLRKKKETGISAAAIGVVKKNSDIKKNYQSQTARGSSRKTLYTTNASTQENLQLNSSKLKHNYTSTPSPMKNTGRKHSSNFSFQSLYESRQISPFMLERVESSQVNPAKNRYNSNRSYNSSNKFSSSKLRKKSTQNQNKSMHVIRMNEKEYSDDDEEEDQQSYESPKFRKHSDFSKLNTAEFDGNMKKTKSERQLNQLNSPYHDQQFNEFEQYYQNKGLAKRKGMNISHKFNPNHSKKKDNYYKELTNVFDQKMEHIGELIVEKKNLEKENKKIKSEVQKHYKEIDITYSNMHETKNLINNQLLINQEKRVGIEHIKNQIFLIQQKMKEIKQSFKDETTPKVEQAVLNAQNASVERDQMLDQMMHMAMETKQEKDALVKNLKDAKECFNRLNQKVEYQRQVDTTRKKLLIEKGNLMKQLINKEKFTSKTVKSQAGKESFNLAKTLKKVLSRAQIDQDDDEE